MNTMNLQNTQESIPEEIQAMPCDMTKPFAFISYAHNDSGKVREIFINLYNRGLNLWIDAANLPHDQNSWSQAALTAYANPNCKCAFFFRSESSVISQAVERELKNIHTLKKPISSIDIWSSPSKTRYNDYYTEFLLKIGTLKEESDEAKQTTDAFGIFQKIVSIIDLDCNAIQGPAEKIMSDMTRDYKKYVGDITSSIGQTTSSTTTGVVIPPSDTIVPLHGAHTVQDLVKKYNDKTFTAKLFGTVGLRIAKHPQYTVAASKTLAQLTLAFVDLCIKEQGEDYIHMVNQKKKNWKNPVFVPSTEKSNYNVTYTTLKNYPSWSLNTNYSPFGHLKNLNSRLMELDIDPADAELIFDEEVSVPSVANK